MRPVPKEDLDLIQFMVAKSLGLKLVLPKIPLLCHTYTIKIRFPTPESPESTSSVSYNQD